MWKIHQTELVLKTLRQIDPNILPLINTLSTFFPMPMGDQVDYIRQYGFVSTEAYLSAVSNSIKALACAFQKTGVTPKLSNAERKEQKRKRLAERKAAKLKANPKPKQEMIVQVLPPPQAPSPPLSEVPWEPPTRKLKPTLKKKRVLVVRDHEAA